MTAADPHSDPHHVAHRELPALMTAVEVAAALRVSRATIYRLVQTGTLPGKHLGRSVRIPRRAVEDLLDVTDTNTDGPA